MTSTMISTLGRGWQATILYAILGDHRVAWQIAAIWRNTKHLAPLPCKERSGYLYEPSRAPCDLQKKMRKTRWDFERVFRPSPASKRMSKKWTSTSCRPVKSWLFIHRGPRTCGGFHLSSGATLSMTKPCWVIHWHQIPRLRGSAGTSAQRTSNRAINLKPPGLPPSSSARKKNPLNLEDISEWKSHITPPSKKKSSTLSFPNKGVQSAGSLLPTLQDLSFTQTATAHLPGAQPNQRCPRLPWNPHSPGGVPWTAWPASHYPSCPASRPGPIQKHAGEIPCSLPQFSPTKLVELQYLQSTQLKQSSSNMIISGGLDLLQKMSDLSMSVGVWGWLF